MDKDATIDLSIFSSSASHTDAASCAEPIVAWTEDCEDIEIRLKGIYGQKRWDVIDKNCRKKRNGPLYIWNKKNGRRTAVRHSLDARQQRTVSTRYGKQFLKKGFFPAFRGALMHVSDDIAGVNIEDDKVEQDEPDDLLLGGATVVDGICWAALKDPTQLHC